MKSSIIKGIVVAGLFSTVVPQANAGLFSESVDKMANRLVDYMSKHQGTFCQQGSESLTNPKLTIRSFGGNLCKSGTFGSLAVVACEGYTNAADKGHENFNDSGCAKNAKKLLGGSLDKEKAAEVYKEAVSRNIDKVKAQGCAAKAKLGDRLSKLPAALRTKLDAACAA